jgi:putative ABC transport system substrate-binding protein
MTPCKDVAMDPCRPRRRRVRAACAAAMSLIIFAAGPSPSAELPRVGLLAWASCAEPGEFEWFMRALADLGYKAGEAVVFECRHAGGRHDGLAPAATELVGIPVDVIVTHSQPAGRAAQQVTQTVPIATIISGDPVAAGMAQSLAHPGGNVTGVSYYATELTAKRLELLKEMVPALAKVGVLANPDVAYLPFEEDTKRAAEHLGLALSIQQVREPGGIDDAFARMKADGAQAAFVLPDVMFANQAPRVAAAALEQHLPAMAWGTWFAELGCLMAYSADYGEAVTRLAAIVDRILKGAKPGDLPIEQPTKFILSINLKTAKALGIEPPQTLLLLADQVIE